MATQKEIRSSLEAQLRDRGADVLHFRALLDDYVFFYAMQRKMQADVRRRGITVKAVSASGKEYDKDNPSLKLAAMYNQRMLAILKDLGLTTESCRPPDDDGGDLG